MVRHGPGNTQDQLDKGSVAVLCPGHLLSELRNQIRDTYTTRRDDSLDLVRGRHGYGTAGA